MINMQQLLDSKTHVLSSNFSSLEAGMHLIRSRETFQWPSKGVSYGNIFKKLPK